MTPKRKKSITNHHYSNKKTSLQKGHQNSLVIDQVSQSTQFAVLLLPRGSLPPSNHFADLHNWLMCHSVIVTSGRTYRGVAKTLVRVRRCFFNAIGPKGNRRRISIRLRTTSTASPGVEYLFFSSSPHLAREINRASTQNYRATFVDCTN